jgi:hypothetical protein
LAAAFPWLRSARIEITEHVANASTSYIKHVVVARAPALFVVPCGDPLCQDGGHNITAVLMDALRRRLATVAGESHCEGAVGNVSCRRSIQFRLTAEGD